MNIEELNVTDLWRELDSQRAVFNDVLQYLIDGSSANDLTNAVFKMLMDSFTAMQETIEAIQSRSSTPP